MLQEGTLLPYLSEDLTPSFRKQLPAITYADRWHVSGRLLFLEHKIRPRAPAMAALLINLPKHPSKGSWR